jgi:hypothetical protein
MTVKYRHGIPRALPLEIPIVETAGIEPASAVA